MLSLIALTALAFAATNVDNVLLLVYVIGRRGQRPGPVWVGALLTSATLVALCLAVAFAVDVAPQRWIGYLGVVPLALGMRELHRLATARREPAEAARDAPPLGAAAVTGVLLANSGDTLGALLPLFAETRDALLFAIAATTLGMSAIGCALAYAIASHARVGPIVERVGAWLVPFALIAVGVYVLLDTTTDTVLAGPEAPPWARSDPPIRRISTLAPW